MGDEKKVLEIGKPAKSFDQIDFDREDFDMVDQDLDQEAENNESLKKEPYLPG